MADAQGQAGPVRNEIRVLVVDMHQSNKNTPVNNARDDICSIFTLRNYDIILTHNVQAPTKRNEKWKLNDRADPPARAALDHYTCLNDRERAGIMFNANTLELAQPDQPEFENGYYGQDFTLYSRLFKLLNRDTYICVVTCYVHVPDYNDGNMQDVVHFIEAQMNHCRAINPNIGLIIGGNIDTKVVDYYAQHHPDWYVQWGLDVMDPKEHNSMLYAPELIHGVDFKQLEHNVFCNLHPEWQMRYKPLEATFGLGPRPEEVVEDNDGDDGEDPSDDDDIEDNEDNRGRLQPEEEEELVNDFGAIEVGVQANDA